MDAGSITVRINGDTTDLNTALTQTNQKLDQSKTKAGDMGKAMFAAQLAFAALGTAVTVVTNVVKQSIQAFKETELSETRLKSLIGGNIQTFKDYAGAIQNATTVEDDSIIAALSYAKTLGIQNNALKSTVDNAIGLSKAFGQDLQTSVKMITLAQQGNTEVLQRFIPELRTVKTESERMAIINKAVANGWKIARDEANTFTGRLEQLKNAQADIMEDTGRIVAIIGKDLVESFISSTRAITEWMNSAKGIEVINGVIGTVKTVIFSAQKIISTLVESLSGIVDSVVNGLKLLFSGLGDSNVAMGIFAGYLQFVTSYLTVMGKVIQGAITGLFNFWNVLKNVGAFLITFWSGYANVFITGFKGLIGVFEALFNAIKKVGENVPKILDAIFKRDWKEVGRLTTDTIKSIGDIGTSVGDGLKNTSDAVTKALADDLKAGKNIIDSIKKFGGDAIGDIKTIVTTIIQEVTDAGGNVEDIIARIKEAYKSVGETTGGGDQLKIPNGTPTSKPGAISISLNTDMLTQSVSVASNILGEFSNKMTSGIGDGISNISDAFVNMKDTLSSTTATMAEKMAAVGKTISSVASSIGSAITSIFDIVNQSMTASLNQQLEQITATHDAELKAIEDKLALETELIENDGKTKEEKRAADLEALNAQLLTETDEKKKADLAEQISALKKEQIITDAKKKADTEKAKSDYKAAKASYDLQKQQFETNQAMQIVQATIAYALGLVQLWSNVWSMGPIAGAILGGVMTGVLTGIFAAQVATIASSKFPGTAPTPPAFAVGTGNFKGGQALVGEAGAEMVNLPEGSEVLPAGLSAWNNQPQIINLIVDGDILRTWQVNNRRSESLYS